MVAIVMVISVTVVAVLLGGLLATVGALLGVHCKTRSAIGVTVLGAVALHVVVWHPYGAAGRAALAIVDIYAVTWMVRRLRSRDASATHTLMGAGGGLIAAAVALLLLRPHI